MRANIGFAKLMLDQKADAITELRNSAAEDPTWPRAQAILATAELLDGNRDIAYRIARAALAADSNCHQASRVMIEAAPETVLLPELDALIPAAHRERPDTLLAFAERARALGDKVGRDRFVTKAAELDSRDWRVLAAQAELLLEPIFAIDGLSLTRAVPDALVGDLNRGIDLLQQAWASVSTRDNVRFGAYVAANLLTAFDVAGRTTEYERLLAAALNLDPAFPPFLRRYARSMAEADDWGAAANAINSIPANDVEAVDRFVKIKARIHSGEALEALADARELERESPGGREAAGAAALEIEAVFAAGERVDECVDEILARWPTSILLRSVAHNTYRENHPRRAILLAQIQELSHTLSDPGDRMHAADALYAAKQFSAAADMYGPLYRPDKDTLPLFNGLRALFFAERRREARELFDSLTPEIKAIGRYADLGIAIYEHSGRLREARQLLEPVLARDDSLLRRLHWLSLSERLDDRQAVIDWLQSVPSNLVGKPQHLMPIALAIDRHIHDPKCFPLAYRALRAAYGDPDLHTAYVIGLVFMGRTRQQLSVPTEVAPDTAVLMAEKDGPRKLVRVLETEPDPKIERGEITPNTELWPQLVGRRVGDEIEVPSLGTVPTVYVIREIRDKYLHAHFRSLEQFEHLFPGHQALRSFLIDKSKGDQKFKPLFDSVRRRAEWAKQLTELYRSDRTPLVLLARFSGVSACDAWDWVIGHFDLGLRACHGTIPEFVDAHNVLTKRRKAVIDPITLYGLTRLGIAEQMRQCFEDLGVVQTTIDLLRRLVAERALDIGKKHGTLSWDGEYYRMIELDDSYSERKVAEAKAALAFSESLTLLPAEASRGVSQTVLDVFEETDPAFLDTLYAAQGADRILYCDDHVLRAVAREATGVDGVWTQPSAMQALLNGMLSEDIYYDIVGALIAADYRLTRIDFRAMLHQLRKDRWAVTAASEAFALQLALPSNEPQSLIRLLADIAQFGWLAKPNVDAYIGVFRVIFRAFRRAQPSRNISELVFSITAILRRRFRHNSFQNILKRKLQDSTILVPAPYIIAAVFQAADETAARLALALESALV